MNLVTIENAGCWIEGNWGHYGSARLIQLAVGLGFGNMETRAVADRYMANEPLLDENGEDLEFEYIMDLADEAEVWMNEAIAPTGYSFGWHDGEFFLWSDQDWEEVS